jgi:hypothetical protein
LIPRSLVGRIAFYGALGALATAAILVITGPLMGPDPLPPLPAEQGFSGGKDRLRSGNWLDRDDKGLSTPEIAVALAVAACAVLALTVAAELVVARRKH